MQINPKKFQQNWIINSQNLIKVKQTFWEEPDATGKLSLNQLTKAERWTKFSFSGTVAWIGGTTDNATPREITEIKKKLKLKWQEPKLK